MRDTFVLGFLGLVVVALSGPASADNARGQCNANIAVALGAAQQVRGTPSPSTRGRD